MRIFIRNLARNIYVRMGGDPLELGRHALCSVSPHFEIIESQLSESEMMKLYLDMRHILSIKNFIVMIDDLKCVQRDLIAKRATKDTLDFARGTLNGIQLVMERMSDFATKATGKDNADYDRFSPI